MPILKKGTYRFIKNPNFTGLTDSVYPRIKYKTYYLVDNNKYAAEPVSFVGTSSGVKPDITVSPKNRYIYLAYRYYSYNAGTGTNSSSTRYEDGRWGTFDYSPYGYHTYTASDDTKLRTIIIEEDTEVGETFYNWAITNGNLEKIYGFKHYEKSNSRVHITEVGDKVYYFKPYLAPREVYKITETLTNCTGSADNPKTITQYSGTTLNYTASDGYKLPDGIKLTNVTSYNWNKAAGVLAISKPTGDVTIEIVAESALPQLSTPTNVAVTDMTLTLNEVANATSYEVFVDNVSIGTHIIASGHTLTITNSSSSADVLQVYASTNGSFGGDLLTTIAKGSTSEVNIPTDYVYFTCPTAEEVLFTLSNVNPSNALEHNSGGMDYLACKINQNGSCTITIG